MSVYLGLSGLYLFAMAVYMLFGFGAGLIVVGGGALLLPDVADVVVMSVLVGLPAEAIVVWRARRDIQWNGVVLICAGLAGGIIVGSQLLAHGSPGPVLASLGVVLVATGVVLLLLPEDAHVRWPRWSAPIVGLLSGGLAGAFGTGGPPLVVWYQLSGVDKKRFRGNLMAIFLVTAAVRLPTYMASGLFTAPRFASAAALLPAGLLGMWLGHRSHVAIPEATFRKLVSVGLAVIGVVLLAK